MRSAVRKLLVLTSGSVAAATFGLPSAAWAATSTTAAASSSAGSCSQGSSIVLIDAADAASGMVNSSNLLYFGSGSARTLCQEAVTSSASAFLIHFSSSGYCLTVDAPTGRLVPGNPWDCTASTTNPAVEWALVAAGRSALGQKAYEVQSLDGGECLEAGNPAGLAACNPAGDDRFVISLQPVLAG